MCCGAKGTGASVLTSGDRLFFVQLYRWFPSILKVITIVHPETLVRWHRARFRRCWRWKSRSLGGQPPINAELRALIRRMSQENPYWGAPRIHGELLKLGFAVAQSTVAKYVTRRSNGPCGQNWPTFVRNHLPQIAAMDLFVVPTIGCDLLYALIVVRLARRQLVWVNVTAHPTAEWIAAGYGGIPLERSTAVPDPGSGCDLWQRCQAPVAGDGYPRQADFGWLAMAEMFCRKADWLNPPGVR